MFPFFRYVGRATAIAFELCFSSVKVSSYVVQLCHSAAMFFSEVVEYDGLVMLLRKGGELLVDLLVANSSVVTDGRFYVIVGKASNRLPR